VGPQRLIAVLLGVASCAPAPKVTRAPARAAPAHVHIIHAMKTPARAAIAARFRERNGREWAVGPAEIEPFRGFVRAARRDGAGNDPRDATGDAAEVAFTFVRQNADLLGLGPAQIVALEEHVVAPATLSSSPPREGSRTIVHYGGRFPMRGYESQRTLDTVVDLDLLVEGRVTGVLNRSVVHPHIAIDLHPVLSSDDPRVAAKLVGRRVFAFANEERIPLGEIQSDDATRVELLVHVSTGPSLAWMTYRLAYAVDIARPVRSGDGPMPLFEPSAFYFFRYVVDADTGDVVEDAKVPVVPAEAFD
jgi:hypothetical protein